MLPFLWVAPTTSGLDVGSLCFKRCWLSYCIGECGVGGENDFCSICTICLVGYSIHARTIIVLSVGIGYLPTAILLGNEAGKLACLAVVETYFVNLVELYCILKGLFRFTCLPLGCLLLSDYLYGCVVSN